jgi:hypothetical protein
MNSIKILKNDKVIREHEITQLFYHVAHTDETHDGHRKITPLFWLGQFLFFDKLKEESLADLIARSEKDNLEFIIFHTEDKKGEVSKYNFMQVELNSFKGDVAFNFKAAIRYKVADA